MLHHRLRIRNVSQLVVVCTNGELVKAGRDQGSVEVLENHSIIVNQDGLIEDIYPSDDDDSPKRAAYDRCTYDADLDGAGRCVLPGFVDAHTHPIWAGDRVHEFALKLAGASYMEVHRRGGGIGYTVSHTSRATDDELMRSLIHRFSRMLRCGTTMVEAKTGYGLACDAEIRLLKLLHRSKEETPMDVVTTYLGAHSIPRGMSASDATDDIVNVQIPLIRTLMDDGVVSPDQIDVFLEKGVFERDDCVRILSAGKSIGLDANFHGDEIAPMRSGQVALEVGARAASHLERISDDDVACLARAGTVAVLLPTTAYILRLDAPPARKLIEAGVPVALGSDFNPNAHCLSMPMVMHLACVNMHMTMDEALVAATLNAAASVGQSSRVGSLEVGKVGDMVMLEPTHVHMGCVPSCSWHHVVYQLGDPPIETVVKRGRVVHQKGSASC